MSPVAEAPSLDGSAWVLSALPDRQLEPGTIVTLRFDAGRAGGVDGCNRYVTSYTADGANLRLLANGASTQMACPRPVMLQAVQAALAPLAAADGSVRLDGSTWVVSAASRGA